MIDTSTYTPEQLDLINRLPRMHVTEPDRWWDNAACVGADPGIFHPDIGQNVRTVIDMYCRQCPVRSQCLQDAIDRRDQHGIWGGLTPTQRTRLGKPKTAPRPSQSTAA